MPVRHGAPFWWVQRDDIPQSGVRERSEGAGRVGGLSSGGRWEEDEERRQEKWDEEREGGRGKGTPVPVRGWSSCPGEGWGRGDAHGATVTLTREMCRLT